MTSPGRRAPSKALAAAGLAAALLGAACEKESQPRASFVPLANVDSAYGHLITVANHPTPDQHGTGERIGLFRAHDGTIWGLPLTLGDKGEILVCAAPELTGAPVTGELPADAMEIVGATNQPTGWRGGTGQLELLIRTADGTLRSHPVSSGETTGTAACWAPDSPGPPQLLHYYRIVREK